MKVHFYLFLVFLLGSSFNAMAQKGGGTSGCAVVNNIVAYTPIVCKGSAVQLLPGVGGDTFTWSPTTGILDPTSGTPMAAPTETTTYTVTGFSGEQCQYYTFTLTVTEPGTPCDDGNPDTDNDVLQEGDCSCKGNSQSITKTGLVLHLDASNEMSFSGSDTTWYDLSSNGNDATLNGATWNNNGYFEFDGIDDFLELSSDGLSFDNSQPFSILVYFQPQNTSTGYLFIKMDNQPERGWLNPGYYLRYDAGISLLVRGTNGNFIVNEPSIPNLNDGAFHLASGIYNGENNINSVNIFHNDSEIPSSNRSNGTPNSGIVPINAQIGGWAEGNSGYFKGAIKAILIYDRALNNAEIKTIYQTLISQASIDKDQDGYTLEEDCDDTNASIHPNAEEIPNNNIDEDCDGVILIIDQDQDGINSDEDCNDYDPERGLPQEPGTPCVDGHAGTYNDVIQANGCDCSGTLCGYNGEVDNDLDGVCSQFDCNDWDPTVGIPQDPGTACDDGNPETTNDVRQADGCTCEGTKEGATKLTLIASKDTYVFDFEVDENYGKDLSLATGFLTAPEIGIRYLLIQFDLSQIPENAQITKANLILFARNDGRSYRTGTISMINSTWEEEVVTWNTKPNSERSQSIALPFVEISENLEVDLKEFVSNISNGTVPNYGFLIEHTGYGDSFYSRENTGSNLRPQLELTYELTKEENNNEGYFKAEPNSDLDIRYTQGKVIIGNSTLTKPGNYRLYVEDGILTEKVNIAIKDEASWADDVFEKDYPLRSLEEIAAFIQKNKHLPNIPSAKEVVEKGMNVAETEANLLRQIEEIWLHLITIDRENKALEKQNSQLEMRMKALEK